MSLAKVIGTIYHYDAILPSYEQLLTIANEDSPTNRQGRISQLPIWSQLEMTAQRSAIDIFGQAMQPIVTASEFAADLLLIDVQWRDSRADLRQAFAEGDYDRFQQNLTEFNSKLSLVDVSSFYQEEVETMTVTQMEMYLDNLSVEMYRQLMVHDQGYTFTHFWTNYIVQFEKRINATDNRNGHEWAEKICRELNTLLPEFDHHLSFLRMYFRLKYLLRNFNLLMDPQFDDSWVELLINYELR